MSGPPDPAAPRAFPRSLRGRITAASSLAVAVAVVLLGAAAWWIVRSHLRGQIDRALVARAAPFLDPHPGAPVEGGPRDADDAHPAPGGAGRGTTAGSACSNAASAHGRGGPQPDTEPAPEPFGGASGYFQFVHASGCVVAPASTQPLLPVGPADRRVAATGRGRYFRDQTVSGTHLRVLVVADPYDHTAVMVARPLTESDEVLRDLLLPFGLLMAGGVVLAAILAAATGRAALAPIGRFVARTEAVSGRPDRAERLEEAGPAELARLAASFNRTLDALERSVAAQRHLVADASHELRTPIAALRTNIQILLRADRLPIAERAEMQAAILIELDELTQLVADVVELARGAEPSEQVEDLRLDDLVGEAVARMRRRFADLSLEAVLEPTAVRNVGDRVGRAIDNLLDNARKWSPPGGRVDVLLHNGVLTVRDHGPGFNPGDLPHVFDRFYRADSARRLPGSGLGLAIVRHAAMAHGGWAEAANAEGGGAEVRVSFGPWTRPAPDPEGLAPAPAALPGAR